MSNSVSGLHNLKAALGNVEPTMVTADGKVHLPRVFSDEGLREIGAAIRQQRISRHVRQMDLCLKLGVTSAHFSNIESGAYKGLQIDFIKKVGGALFYDFGPLIEKYRLKEGEVNVPCPVERRFTHTSPARKLGKTGTLDIGGLIEERRLKKRCKFIEVQATISEREWELVLVSTEDEDSMIKLRGDYQATNDDLATLKTIINLIERGK